MMVLAKEEKEKVLRSARTRPWEVDHELEKKNRDHMQPVTGFQRAICTTVTSRTPFLLYILIYRNDFIL